RPLRLSPCRSGCSRHFQSVAVPAAKISAGFIGTLQKIQQRAPGRIGSADIIVHQEELAQLRVVKRWAGLYPGKRVSLGFRHGVGVKRGAAHAAAAGPKSGADHFVRVGCAGDGIGAWALRCTPAAEPAYRQVKAAPEEMHGTALAQEARTKFQKNAVDRHQNAPETVGIFGVVSSMYDVTLKGNRVGHFAGFGIDPNLQSE